MNKIPIEPGSVVISTAGRDQGRLYMVIERLDEDFVTIANGKLRTMDRLKKKRVKHLKPIGGVVREYAEKQGTPVMDHEIRSWLKREEEKLVQV